MILCYSGCGNSRFVADELARLTSDRVEDMDLMAPSPSVTLAVGEPLGIVCPVYAWRVPRVVEAHIEKLHTDAVPSYCYLVCSCGDNAGSTDSFFARLLSLKGWHLDAAFTVIMPETYVNLKAFKLDTPEKAKAKTETTRKRLPSIANHINLRHKVTDMVRGAVPRLKSGIVNSLFYMLLITDKRFVVHDSCIGCGICQQHCPLHNITLHDGRPQWHGNCTNCMSCYHRCPQNAIHFGTVTENKGQYYFGKG